MVIHHAPTEWELRLITHKRQEINVTLTTENEHNNTSTQYMIQTTTVCIIRIIQCTVYNISTHACTCIHTCTCVHVHVITIRHTMYMYLHVHVKLM